MRTSWANISVILLASLSASAQAQEDRYDRHLHRREHEVWKRWNGVRGPRRVEMHGVTDRFAYSGNPLANTVDAVIDIGAYLARKAYTGGDLALFYVEDALHEIQHLPFRAIEDRRWRQTRKEPPPERTVDTPRGWLVW